MNQNNEVLVTIGIPFYNADKYLDESIQSVFNQTYNNWNLLLIDDGSTDNSMVIANKYKNDPRVTLHSDGDNKNLGFRLNQITALVCTKYLARMDADDIMHPDKIRKQIEVLESHPEINVLGTNAFSIDEKNTVNGVRMLYSKNEGLRKVNGFIHPTIIAKTQWFRDNPYDVNAVRIEDVELWFRTSDSYNFQVLTEPLFFYREIGTDYYKKYFKGVSPLFYVLKKHKYNVGLLKFGIKYCITGLVYFLFNIIGKESILVCNRNAVKMDNLTIAEVLKNSQ